MALLVDYDSNQITNISSNPTQIFVGSNKTIITSIIITNTTENSLLLNVQLLRDPVLSYFVINLPITGYGKQEIVNTNFQNNIGISTTDTELIVRSGDELLASSDFVTKTFDCIVCYRALLET